LEGETSSAEESFPIASRHMLAKMGWMLQARSLGYYCETWVEKRLEANQRIGYK